MGWQEICRSHGVAKSQLRFASWGGEKSVALCSHGVARNQLKSWGGKKSIAVTGVGGGGGVNWSHGVARSQLQSLGGQK